MSGNPELRYELVRDGPSVEIHWRPERRFAVASITLGLNIVLFGAFSIFLPEWSSASMEDVLVLGVFLPGWPLFVSYGLLSLLCGSESIRLESTAVCYTRSIWLWQRTKDYLISEIRGLCIGQWSGRLGTGVVGMPYTLSALVFDYCSRGTRFTKWMDPELAAMIIEEIRRYHPDICAPSGTIVDTGAETAQALTTVKLN